MNAKEIRASEWFSEDVGDIVTRLDSCDGEFAVGNQLLYGVVLDKDVFNLQVLYVVFSERAAGVIIAV